MAPATQKVWLLVRWVDDGSYEGHTEPYAAFGSEEDAKASAGRDDEIEVVVLYGSPLRTQKRWRAVEAYRQDRVGPRSFGGSVRYVVNELHDDYDAGVKADPFGFGSQVGFSAPTRKEAVDAVKAAITR